MAKKIQLKSAQNDNDVKAFLDAVEPQSLRDDSYELLELFESITGMEAKMWGTSIIGFGEYTYYRSNGAEGSYLATGFSPRKSGPTIYIMPGYQDYSDILNDLGKHKLGKSCLYLKRLSDIDKKILEKLIKQGLKDLKASHETSY